MLQAELGPTAYKFLRFGGRHLDLLMSLTYGTYVIVHMQEHFV